MVSTADKMTRREFAEVLAAGFVVTLAPATLMGCAGITAEITSTADAVILGKRTVIDHAGLEHQIPVPEGCKKVFFTSALAQVYITTLCPDLLAGTAGTFTESQLRFQPSNMLELPVLGNLNNNGDIDAESLLYEGIDIMFSISGIQLTQNNIDDAQRLQNLTKIPVLLVDGSFSKIPDAYRFLGDILGRKERAVELAEFCAICYQSVHEVVLTIPQEKRISVYYAEGPEGLETEPETSQHMLGFLEGGAKCVATVNETYGGGMTPVNLEQVLKWDPEVIIGWDTDVRGGAVDDIRTNKDWAQIQAVQNGRVFAMPNEPWAWCDRPPGVNRLIGIHWVANLLYPDVYDVDMKEITREYFRVMYQKDVDDETILGILGDSYPPPPQLVRL